MDEVIDGQEPVRSPADALRDEWASLSAEDRLARFTALKHADAEELFLMLDDHDHVSILLGLPPKERRAWMRSLAPDDAADTVQEAPTEEREALLGLLDEPTRKEVAALMKYAEDDAGGLMNPRFSSTRPDVDVDEALSYLRRRARDKRELTYYVYVIDAAGKLIGVVSLRGLFAAPPKSRVRDVMHAGVISVPEDMDQEAVGQLFSRHDLVALPVVDADGRMKGLVSIDDIVDVVQEEATEDIHKMAGMQALDVPYLDAPILEMVRKRASWLSLLLVGEMLTATALGFFQKEIDRATVLALFMPLIISSGGNSGSQASTLVVRAMALDEVRLMDWFRVMKRELASGLLLGICLAVIGFARIILWHVAFGSYPDHVTGLALTVAISLVGVVMFGTLAGSMLPFLLRRAGLDPASASAPFVATLVDVTGLVIYFSVASVILAEMLQGP
jgi:magnesium transporter